MSPRALLGAGLLVLGLALALWPALSAPVVLWGDSTIDLQWARTGVGIFRPAPSGAHPAKPVYLLFLRAAMALPFSKQEERRAVIVQSLLLWLSIAATAYYLGRRRGAGVGIALYIVLILFLRLRDASSAVMTEALTAAILLPIVAFELEPPQRARGFLLLGLGTGALFWIRPNAGLVALLLGVIPILFGKRWTRLLPLAAGLAAVAFPIWIASRTARESDRLRGLSFPILEASADYYWHPSIEPWPQAGSERELARQELSLTVERWKATLSARGPDARRQLLWRAFHGLLGSDFYDARWSPYYQFLTTASRIASPFAVLASIAILFAIHLGAEARVARAMGVFLVLLLVAQDLVLGSNPRYVLPFFPALFLLAVSCAPALARARSRALAAAILFGLLVLCVARQRASLDWQWGMIESAGVTIRQPIARGALPGRTPATLHIRIAAPVVPTNTQIRLSAIGRPIWSSEGQGQRERPEITVPLPLWLLEENVRRPVELEVTSLGDYGRTSYLLFPVIPPPWPRVARRDGAAMLSPATGILSGSLDWWAHEGEP
jgi:hypothetical protein